MIFFNLFEGAFIEEILVNSEASVGTNVGMSKHREPVCVSNGQGLCKFGDAVNIGLRVGQSNSYP